MFLNALSVQDEKNEAFIGQIGYQPWMSKYNIRRLPAMLICDPLCGDCSEHRVNAGLSPDRLSGLLEMEKNHKTLSELTSKTFDQARERNAKWLVLLIGDPTRHAVTSKASRGLAKIPVRFRESCQEPYTFDNVFVFLGQIKLVVIVVVEVIAIFENIFSTAGWGELLLVAAVHGAR